MLWWWFATKVRDAAWNEITTCEITAYNVLPYEKVYFLYNIIYFFTMEYHYELLFEEDFQRLFWNNNQLHCFKMVIIPYLANCL